MLAVFCELRCCARSLARSVCRRLRYSRQMVDSTRDLAKETGELFKKLTMAHADNVPVRESNVVLFVSKTTHLSNLGLYFLQTEQKAKIAHDRLRKNFETWLKEFQDVSKLSVAKEREFQPRPDDDAAVFGGIGSGPNAGLSSGLGGRGAHFTEQVRIRARACCLFRFFAER